MTNVSAITSKDIRRLRRAFGKLRHRKLWTKHVKGGVGCIEITNIGNGWHPHLHAVVDCLWLAWKTPAPYPSMPRENKLKLYKAAAIELETVWSKILGQPSSSVRVKRANRFTIAKEVVKYALKGQDLIQSSEPIGDMIRSIQATRLMTTFGIAHGQSLRDIRAEAKLKCKADAKEHQAELEPRCGCGDEDFVPDEVYDMIQRRDAKRYR